MTIYFYRNDGVVQAVSGISYQLKAGESLGIVGDSGCGKSVSVLSLRVMIAMVLACKPKLLIADEPTTALDVTVRSHILNLLQDMKEEYNMSVIMITHDFSVATNFCDRINVMYADQIVETAPTIEFVNSAKHPYSKGLLKSTLDIDYSDDSLNPIPGNPPSLMNPGDGCRFYPRCSFRKEICKRENPELKSIGQDHSVACHLIKGEKQSG